jgi:hypothetical protein
MADYRVGVTGTRDGATAAQLAAMRILLTELTADGGDNDLWFHHGDCVGVDAQAAGMAAGLGWSLWSHPPSDDRYRAFLPASLSDSPVDYFSRNREIVHRSDIMIVVPKKPGPINWTAPYVKGEGGTMYTGKYAHAQQRTMFIVWPDGRLQCGAETTDA